MIRLIQYIQIHSVQLLEINSYHPSCSSVHRLQASHVAKDCYQLCLLWCLHALCKTLTELFLVALCGSPIIDSHMTHVWYTNGLINMVYFLQLPLLTCIWVLFGVNDDKWWYIFHGSICLQVIQSSVSKSLSPRAVGSIAFGCTFRSFRPNQVIYDDGIWWMYLLAFWDQGNTWKH